MRSYFVLFIIGILLVSFSCKQDPCATKEGFLTSFENFTTEYEEKKSDLTDNEKAVFMERFKHLVNGCYKKYKPDMTLSEKQEFWKKGLSYYMSKFSNDDDIDLSKELEDPFGQYIKEEVIALVKESGFEFLSSLQEVVELELPKLMEVFSKEIQNMGQEILDLFK